jgi:two-component system, chemotaxis family, protein-glutamate methylesterase/glutaminase
MARGESSNGTGRDIVVIGASAGGVQALQELMRGLPADFAASIFVVIHTSPSSPGVLPQILDRAGPMPAVHADDWGKIRHGRVYVAPPDFHLLLNREGMRVTRGPKENGFRPAVDALFRTAARAYGARVVGIVLTGVLDDGTVGLIHIKKRGGIAVAQEPSEAVFSSMPQSAIDNADVDYVLPVAEMPALLSRLASEPLAKGAMTMATKEDDEPDVAEAGQSLLVDKHSLGPPTSLTCPECGGSLWERKDGKVSRFQCHVGHSYTAESLLSEKADQLESVLWTALRALEENADLRRRMARRMSKGPGTFRHSMAQQYANEAQEAEQRAAVLREALTNGDSLRGMADESGAEKKARRSSNQSVKATGKNGGTRGQK